MRVRDAVPRLLSRLNKRLQGTLQPELASLAGIRRAWVLAPHPDDDVIGMGGAMSMLASTAEVSVLYLTDGQRGVPGVSHLEAADLRRDEARAAAGCVGVSRLDFLGAMDSELRVNRFTVAFVSTMLARLQPDAIFVPSLTDRHPDHAAAAQLLAHALRNTRAPVTCWCYEVWTPLMPNRILDISAVEQSKRTAIRAHATQVAQMDFDERVAGLNRYRAMAFPGMASAEAFLCLDRSSYLDLARSLGKGLGALMR